MSETLNGAVAMVVFSTYPADVRVRREAEALVDAGAQVDVICLRDGGQVATETLAGVQIHRVPGSRTRGSRFSYLREYGSFAIRALSKLSTLHRHRKYDVVHAHNLPDILVFCGLIPRLTGARIVLDVHDIMPEFYMQKYGLPNNHVAVRFIRLAERLAAGFAHHVVVASPLMRERLVSRSVPAARCTAILNLPDRKLFPLGVTSPREPHDTFRLVYPGTLSEVHGVDLAVRAIHRLRTQAGLPIELHVYGTGPRAYVDGLRALVESLRLHEAVFLHGWVPTAAYRDVLRSMDVGVVPKRSGVFADLAMSTKLMEFAAVGLPAIASRTTPDTLFFDEAMVAFFEPGNAEALASVIADLHRDRSRLERLAKEAQRVFEIVSWETERTKLREVYRELLPGPTSGRRST